METNSSNETDITAVFDWAKRRKNNFFLGIDTFIKFLRRNIFWLIGLIVVGGLLGYFIDRIIPKNYETSLIIRANQNSTENIYNFVEGFNKKIDDTTYIYKNSFKKKEITKVEIEPIVNFNDLLNKYRNKDIALLETLLENASAENILESEFFRSDYSYHTIKMDLGKEADTSTVSKFLDLINDNRYFRELNAIAKVYNSRAQQEYEQILRQVDTAIEKYNKQISEQSQINKIIVSNNQNSEMSELIRTKKSTLSELEYLKLERVSLKNTLLLVNEPVLVKRSTILNKMTVLLPIFFVLMFFIIAYFKHSVRKIRSQTVTSAH